MGGRKVGGERLCDLLGMGSERKEKPQQVSCYRPGGTGSEEAEGGVWICSQQTHCSGKNSPWSCQWGSTGAGVGTKQRVGGQRLEGENLWDLQEKETEEQGRLPKVFCQRAVDEAGAWV